MTTDNKTLADVQPGGRVRLWDGAERARFEAWAHAQSYRGGNIMADRDAVHPDVYADPIAQLTWKSWKAALSAQPSPGGQGEALKALDDLAAFCSDDAATVDRHVAVIRAALADRQPVGQEPVAYGVINRDGLWMCDFGLATINKESAESFAAWAEEHRTISGPFTVVSLYAAPPAQAVDLGSVRAALDAAEGLAVVCASVDGYSREEVAASGRAMRQQFADARAPLDSQAVGNK